MLDSLNMLRAYVESRRADLEAAAGEWQRVADAARTNAERDAAAAEGYRKELATFQAVENALRSGAQPQSTETVK